MNRLLIAYPQSITASSPASLDTGEVVLDLYKDEVIPFQFKVDDFTNVAEKSSSNSKSFEIPGTKNNNLFFNHIYEVTSDSLFNPHKKTRVVYKENGIDIFSGFLQLNDIVIKNNNVSYEITLFSETINLKDSIGNRILRDLDLNELNHLYTESDIKDSWTGNLNYTSSSTSTFRDGATIKYPFVRYNTNTSYASSLISTGIGQDVYKPWINCRYLVKSILAYAGYTCTSNFIDSAAFNKLYLDIPASENMLGSSVLIADTPAATTYSSSTWTTLDFTNTTFNSFASNLYNTATDIFTSNIDDTIVSFAIHLDFIVTVASFVQVRIKHNGSSLYANNQLIYNQIVPVGTTSTLIFNPLANVIDLSNGNELEFEIIVSGSLTLDTNSRIYYTYDSGSNVSMNNNLIGFRGELKQWDFLKNFIDKFNLLIMADESNPNNLIIEPYSHWTDTGNLLDWTNKIDDREIKYTTIDGLAREISFTHIEDTPDWSTINNNYPAVNKWAHYFKSDVDIIDKDLVKIEVKEAASTKISSNLGGQLIVPSIINTDTSMDFWQNKPRILYDNGVISMSTHKYHIGVLSWFNETDYLLFSPVDIYPITSNTKSLDFGIVDYGIGGTAVLKSLYNEYWAKYIDELYHKDTRIATVKAFLSAKDISDFRFNDVIMIKNKKYRVKKIDYNQNHLSKLELITIKDL